MHPLRLRLLREEAECISRLAVAHIDELEETLGAERTADVPVLIQGILSLAIKISYLLWRFGRRVTDRYGLEEAEHLARRLRLVDTSPLAPPHLSAMVELLTSTPAEMEHVVTPETLTVTTYGVTHPLRPIFFALRELHSRLVSDGALDM